MLDTIHPFQCQDSATMTVDGLHWVGRALSAGQPLTPTPPGGWDEILPAIVSHQIAPLLYVMLRDRPAGAAGRLPEGLTNAFQQNASRSMAMDLALREIIATLAEVGIPCLLLKGAALGRMLYASPAERPVSDLDLLVSKSDLAAADMTLTGQGYRPLGPRAGGRLGQALYRYKAELPIIGISPANRGLLVELHWTLTEMPYYIDRIDVADVWRGTQAVPGLPAAQAPDPAVLLLHACAHLALHHSRDLRLIWLVDLDRLARWAALDWQRVIRLAEAWGLGLAVQAGLAAAARWLDTPIPEPVERALLRLAQEPVGHTLWGLGDETLPGRGWRRARATWAAFDARQRARYAGWLGLRVLHRPVEWMRR